MKGNYRESRFCENLNIARFDVAGKYNTPVLQPYQYQQTEFVGFNYARTTKDRGRKGIHFFLTITNLSVFGEALHSILNCSISFNVL